MRRILKYQYYNAREFRPKFYRVKILKSKKQKWKFFIKKQGWYIKKLLRKARWIRKNKKQKKIIYFCRRKKARFKRFRRRIWRKKRRIKNYLKTYVKTFRWLKLKKANAAFFSRRSFYADYEKFFGKGFLKVEIENHKNKNKSVSIKSFKIKPLFNYAVLLFRAGLLSTVHESISHFRAGHAFENSKKIKHSKKLFLGSFYGSRSIKVLKPSTPLKCLRKKYSKKSLLLLFTEIDYYAKSFVVVKNLSDLKNKECSLLMN